MTHSISSTGTSPLHLLQAQQAFGNPRVSASSEQNRSGLLAASELPTDEAILSNGKRIQNQSRPNEKTSTVSAQHRTKFTEINTIAQKVGYVGLTESDIQRAMVSGESLLTDYRA